MGAEVLVLAIFFIFFFQLRTESVKNPTAMQRSETMFKENGDVLAAPAEDGSATTAEDSQKQITRCRLEGSDWSLTFQGQHTLSARSE